MRQSKPKATGIRCGHQGHGDGGYSVLDVAVRRKPRVQHVPRWEVLREDFHPRFPLFLLCCRNSLAWGNLVKPMLAACTAIANKRKDFVRPRSHWGVARGGGEWRGGRSEGSAMGNVTCP